MAGMREMWREASPRGAIADLKVVFQQAGKNRWRIAIASALVTFGMFSVMTSQSWKKGRELPEVTYINSWPEDRTAAETQAFIEENQRRKEERAALEAKVDAETKAFWKSLGRASGMDVEAMEAQIEAERKAAEAAKGQLPVDR
jgi:DNA-binding helix-hairpin-helix protein with protein kinase domain